MSCLPRLFYFFETTLGIHNVAPRKYLIFRSLLLASDDVSISHYGKVLDRDRRNNKSVNQSINQSIDRSIDQHCRLYHQQRNIQIKSCSFDGQHLCFRQRLLYYYINRKEVQVRPLPFSMSMDRLLPEVLAFCYRKSEIQALQNCLVIVLSSFIRACRNLTSYRETTQMCVYL